MKFNILTLFPDFFDVLNNYGVIGKGIDKKIIEINKVNIRDFTIDKHKRVDDELFGGGAGMLMTPQPLYDSIKSVRKTGVPVIYLSPQGRVLNQKLCNELSNLEEITLICGHYEGIDSRIVDEYVDMEVSIGDYCLSGGEVGALVLIDAISRLIKGVLGNEESPITDSHYNNLLQHNIYTRPRDFKGLKVPEVLFSGNHKLIEEWKEKSALENTKNKRPDLYKKYLEKHGPNKGF
ncbi:MAG: tRNA (guanosine(37)-N1)-methyltransferase TrmD [Lagierella massiliensis]|nr:tRNA (guanosine(37)-N1)-methyltransferase TrmD [Lagierella massiliensis]